MAYMAIWIMVNKYDLLMWNLYNLYNCMFIYDLT